MVSRPTASVSPGYQAEMHILRHHPRNNWITGLNSLYSSGSQPWWGTVNPSSVTNPSELLMFHQGWEPLLQREFRPMWYSNAATSLAHWLLHLFPGCPLKEFCCLFPQIVVLCVLNTKIMSGFFCECVLSRMSCVQLFATLWTAAHLWGSSVLGILQANILEWVACHALHQGIFPTQGSNLHLLHLLHWQAGSLPIVPPGKPSGSF